MKHFLVFCFAFLSLAGLSAQIDQTLLEAIKANDLTAVKKTKLTPIMLNAQDEHRASVLMWAAYKSDLEMVKHLVEQGANPRLDGAICLDDSCGSYYGSLIGVVAGEGKVEMLRYFVEEIKIPVDDLEWNPATGKKDGWTALHWAAWKGQEASAQYLLEKGAKLNVKDTNGDTPLALAFNSLEDEGTTVYLIAKAMEVFPEGLKLLNNYHPLTFGEELAYKRFKKFEEGVSNIDVSRSRIWYFRWQYLVKNPSKKNKILRYYALLKPELNPKKRLVNLGKAAKLAEKKLDPTLFSKAHILLAYAWLHADDPIKAQQWFRRTASLTGYCYFENEILLENLFYRICNPLFKKYPTQEAKAVDEILRLNESWYRRANYARSGWLAYKGELDRERNKPSSLASDLHTMAYLDTLALKWPDGQDFFWQTQVEFSCNAGEYYHKNNNCDGAKQLLAKGYSTFQLLDSIDHCQEDPSSYRCISTSLFSIDVFKMYSDCLLCDSLDHSSLVANLIAYFENSFGIRSFDDYSTQSRAYNPYATQGIYRGEGGGVQELYPVKVHTFNLIRSDPSVKYIGLKSTYRFKNSDFFSESTLRNQLRQNPEIYQKFTKAINEYMLTLSGQTLETKTLRQTAESMEATIKDLLPNFELRGLSKNADITKTNLTNQEAIIEIVQVPQYKGGYQREEEPPADYRYIAYLLTSDGLEAVPLGKQSQLEQHLLASDTVNSTAAGVEVLLRGGKAEAVRKTSPILFGLVWTQLLDSLLQAKGIQTIWLSPDGLLHRIPFSAVKDPFGEPLGQKYQINTVISTRLLAEKNRRQTETKKTAFLFGGIDYQTAAMLEINTRSSPTQTGRSLGVDRGGAIVPLPGTRREVTQIKSDAVNTPWQVVALTDASASEAQLKALSGTAPRVVHLATHGYYHLLGKDSAEMALELPLFRSGLLLAGAQPSWVANKGFGHPGKDDGILTAFEVSLLDFTGTELVVLSACKTGRGDILESEGVFGLQRAFKLAGARFVLMSLWQVDDAKTADFMIEFYKRYFAHSDVRRAFHETQKHFIEHKKEPYFWAGFILVE